MESEMVDKGELLTVQGTEEGKMGKEGAGLQHGCNSALGHTMGPSRAEMPLQSCLTLRPGGQVLVSQH